MCVKQNKKHEDVVLHYVKLITPLSFQIRFVKKWTDLQEASGYFHGTKHRKDNQLQSLELPCRIS